MTAEEFDVDPVISRREEIQSLSNEAYDDWEKLNFANLEALSIVKSVKPFSYGKGLSQNGVQVNLNCTQDCNGSSQPRHACRKDVPTRAQAAEQLLATLVETHAECIADRNRWNRGETSTAPTALSHISTAQYSTVRLSVARWNNCEGG